MSRRQPEQVFMPGQYFKPPPAPVIRPLRKLTAVEEAQVAENKALLYQMGPDAVEFVKDLHAAGLIPGWRAVGEVELFNDPSTGSGRMDVDGRTV